MSSQEKKFSENMVSSTGPDTSVYSVKNSNGGENVSKAQTSIDLLLAVTIFFAVIGLLIGQNPAIFAPSGIPASDTKMTSDRIAEEIIEKEFTHDGATVMNNESVAGFLNNASENNEFLEKRFSLDTDRGMKIRLSVNTTNDDRKIPSALNNDNTGLNYTDSIESNENSTVIIIESKSFDGSGSSSTRYATLDDRRIELTVSVGRPL